MLNTDRTVRTYVRRRQTVRTLCYRSYRSTDLDEKALSPCHKQTPAAPAHPLDDAQRTVVLATIILTRQESAYSLGVAIPPK